jgi:hypothetical protein
VGAPVEAAPCQHLRYEPQQEAAQIANKVCRRGRGALWNPRKIALAMGVKARRSGTGPAPRRRFTGARSGRVRHRVSPSAHALGHFGKDLISGPQANPIALHCNHSIMSFVGRRMRGDREA